MSPVPQSILRALSLPNLDPSKATLSTSGLGSGFSNTGRITVFLPSNGSSEEEEEERQYFVKTSPDGKEMFEGEFASLNAIADVVPGFCPRALGWGSLEDNKGYFLVTEFLDLSGRPRSSGTAKSETGFAQRLGKLHSTPAPSSSSSTGKKYGFPVPTYCGNTRQPNSFHDSWEDFYSNERLLMILKESERKNGSDAGLRDLVTKTAEKVVPRLLGDDHLGYDRNGQGEGIYPVVVHGDLWSGNASHGRIVRSSSTENEGGGLVYDPSACYAHNEYELGIMHMFGGFGKAFFDEYHSIVPRTEPVEEYEDRVKLYELYHHLNHHAIFGGGYRSGAVSIMSELIDKYGRG
ncbi:hypothetical protein EYB25_005793 [Talaromyces marneffei]|nr:uncharacterized protein EYB26_006913 [Talaromyces marneffei]KAE8551902.1 hypothetical protein EYB25_005793 [Talaromyces marneffei]QGA19225.1 hypothetical protein EYB26_006913 [Talaromyces marneffei]